MRKTTFLCMLLLATSFVAAKVKTVKAPLYTFSNTCMLEVAQVTLSDTATIVEMEVYHTPGKKVKFLKSLALRDADGEMYPFRWCADMKPGKSVKMPDDGRLSLSLVFEPLPRKCKSFDFVEGDDESSWLITGISLTGKLPKNKEIARLEKVKLPDTPLPAKIVAAIDTATITGRFVGVPEGQQISALSAYYYSPFSYKSQEVSAAVAADGTFTLKIPAYAPMCINLHRLFTMYVEPGKESQIVINAREITRRSGRIPRAESGECKGYFAGAMARVNADAERDEVGVIKFWQQFRNVDEEAVFSNFTIDQYKALMLHYHDSIKSLIEAQSWCDAYKEICHIENDIACCEILNKGEFYLRVVYKYNGVKGAKSYRYYEHYETPDSAYFDYLTLLVPHLGSGKFLLSTRAYDAVNSVDRYADASRRVSSLTLAGFLCMQNDSLRNITLSRALAERVREIADKEQAGITPTRADSLFVDSLTMAFPATMTGYMAKYVEKEKKNRLIRQYLGENSPFFDWEFANRCYQLIVENYTPLTADMLADLQKIEIPYIVSEITMLHKDMQAYISRTREASKEVTALSDDLRGEELFRALVAPYRGKVVLVDVWETWCGPCRMAMTAMRPLKERMKGRDIVFLYVASESSPHKTWSDMIKGIPGEHIFLTKEQKASLTGRFEISGVPTFFFVDKEGLVRKKQTGFRGVDFTEKELEKLMK
ncbi:MAG: TlpA family protein disulfide reductase [Coprobacter sp.]|nr:TlpA family protein disulfide reductase [Coprobacter sp.]